MMKSTSLLFYAIAPLSGFKTWAVARALIHTTPEPARADLEDEARLVDRALARICHAVRQMRVKKISSALRLVALGANPEIQDFLPWRAAAWIGDVEAMSKFASGASCMPSIRAALDAHSGAVEWGRADARRLVSEIDQNKEHIFKIASEAAADEAFASEDVEETFARHFVAARKFLYLADYAAFREQAGVDSRAASAAYYNRSARSWLRCQLIEPRLPPLPPPLCH